MAAKAAGQALLFINSFDGPARIHRRHAARYLAAKRDKRKV